MNSIADKQAVSPPAEWGYFIGAAPKGHPTIVSRLITADYTGQICTKAFPPGELNGEPAVDPGRTVQNDC